MVSIFEKKKIETSEPVCVLLKQARIKSGKTLEEMAKATKINSKYLEALEECRFDFLPKAQVYKKCIVKKYSEAIGKNPEPYLRQYCVEDLNFQKRKTTNTKALNFKYLYNLPLFTRSLVIGSLIASFVFYLGMQVKRILEPPQLVITSPQDGYITQNNPIKIQGFSDKEVTIKINGKEISNSENGQFQEIISLNNGVNILVISANKKHGKVISETRHIILKSNSEFSYKK